MKNNKFINKIICADTLELLPQIEENSIDVVLTDPPYFLDKMINTHCFGLILSIKPHKRISYFKTSVIYCRSHSVIKTRTGKRKKKNPHF